MSRKLWLVLFLAVSTVATFWYGARSNPVKPAAPPAAAVLGEAKIPSPETPTSTSAVAPNSTAAMPSVTKGTPVIPGSTQLSATRPRPEPQSPAKIEADTLALNIRHYSQRFGGNPVGSNAEIVREMTGGNLKGATYLPPELKRLNDNGELIDTWGTPYFFHQNTANYMEVRSAGPDKKLWTTDDVTAR
ncbi:MAG: hypothetical protein ABL974_00365 [Prosthecobacter sp.]